MDIRNPRILKINPIVGMLIFVVVIIIIFYIAKSLISIIYWLAPIFLIIALLLNYRVVPNYLKSMMNTLRNNPPIGIAQILLSVIAYPFLFILLMLQAYFGKKLKESGFSLPSSTRNRSFQDFEILDEEKLEQKRHQR